jgi:hypothetical protein
MLQQRSHLEHPATKSKLGVSLQHYPVDRISVTQKIPGLMVIQPFIFRYIAIEESTVVAHWQRSWVWDWLDRAQPMSCSACVAILKQSEDGGTCSSRYC